MNLQEELKVLKQRIAELEEQAKDEQEFPQEGHWYWYMTTTGKIFNSNWDGFVSEEYMLEIGNIFRTKEQAEFAVEKLKVEAELRKYGRPFVDGECNNHIKYSQRFDELSISTSLVYQTQGVIYFESGEKARQAIKSVGEERIKKYIFGVEDQL